MIKVNEGTEANVSKIINIMDQIVFSDATVQSTNPLLSTIAHALLRTIAERKAKKRDDSAASAAKDDRDGGGSKQERQGGAASKQSQRDGDSTATASSN